MAQQPLPLISVGPLVTLLACSHVCVCVSDSLTFLAAFKSLFPADSGALRVYFKYEYSNFCAYSVVSGVIVMLSLAVSLRSSARLNIISCVFVHGFCSSDARHINYRAVQTNTTSVGHRAESPLHAVSRIQKVRRSCFSYFYRSFSSRYPRSTTHVLRGSVSRNYCLPQCCRSSIVNFAPHSTPAVLYAARSRGARLTLEGSELSALFPSPHICLLSRALSLTAFGKLANSFAQYAGNARFRRVGEGKAKVAFFLSVSFLGHFPCLSTFFPFFWTHAICLHLQFLERAVFPVDVLLTSLSHFPFDHSESKR